MRISVALCTYNGARYLPAQLDSFAAQILLPAELVVCDDGSTDTTLSIVEAFAASAPFPVRIYRNRKNLGVRSNFCQAIELCQHEFIALSDQDDIWLPEKLVRARTMLERTENPSRALYCSRLLYTNGQLEILGNSKIPKEVGFANAILENIATGCSVVFGCEIKKLMSRASPTHMQMHDWWAYLVASAFGEIVYDTTSSVFYRQHGQNVAGWEPRMPKLKKRLKALFLRLSENQKSGMDSLNQAILFAATYSELKPEYRHMISELTALRDAPIRSRLQYALSPRVARNDALENAAVRLLFIMGWH